MLRRLQLGVPEDVLPLLELPLSLTRGELLGLRAIGVRTVDGFWTLPMPSQESVLGAARCKQVNACRPATAGVAKLPFVGLGH